MTKVRQVMSYGLLQQISYAFQQCKYFENPLGFDKVTESSKMGTFLRHSVYVTLHKVCHLYVVIAISSTIDSSASSRRLPKITLVRSRGPFICSSLMIHACTAVTVKRRKCHFVIPRISVQSGTWLLIVRASADRHRWRCVHRGGCDRYNSAGKPQPV